ncbi:hypothetical protein RQP46_010405 [Phenoliferia psychrophenolica]
METSQLSMAELGTSSKQHSPHLDSSTAPPPAPPNGASPRTTALVLLVLIASSTFATFTLQRSRLYSTRVLLALPIAEWSFSLACLWLVARTLRRDRVVLLIALLISTRKSEADSSSPRKIEIASALVAVVGLVFLGGGPQSASGVAVSMAQVGVTSIAWIAIENSGEIWTGSAVTIAASALISHIAIYLLSTLLHLHSTPLPYEPPEYTLALAALPFATSAAFLALLSLSAAPSRHKILSDARTIYVPARNFLVLALGSYVGLGGGVAHALEPYLATSYLLAFAFTILITHRVSTTQHHLPPPPKLRTTLPRLAILPFLLFTLTSLFPTPFLPLPLPFQPKNANLTIDLVIAHYDTPLSSTSQHLSQLLAHPFFSLRHPRIFIYEKGSTPTSDLWAQLPLDRERGDEVAPDDDPIHQSWGPNGSGGRSNPAFGHSVERSWPLIFDCDDPALSRRCDDLSWKVEDCQCSD